LKPTSAPIEKLYVVTKEGREMTVKPAPAAASKDSFVVPRHRYVHDSACDFHRLILTATQPDGNLFPLALDEHRVDDEPHDVVNRPHGNSKTDIPFVRTKKSTIKKLTEEVQKQKSVKRAIFNAEESEDGMMAKSQSSLPRK
jgi:hypothetical protein